MDTKIADESASNEYKKSTRFNSDYQTFDSDIIEGVERSCDVALADLKDRRKNRKKVEAKLQEVGLCNNMINESYDYATDINYQIRMAKGKLESYRKDMVSAEEGGINFFTGFNIDLNSPTVIPYILESEVEGLVSNLPSLDDSAVTIGTGSTSVVDTQTIVPGAEQVDLVNILPDTIIENSSGEVVVDSQEIAPDEEEVSLYNILPESLRGERTDVVQNTTKQTTQQTTQQNQTSEIPMEGMGGLFSSGTQSQPVQSNQSINEIASNFTSGIGSGL